MSSSFGAETDHVRLAAFVGFEKHYPPKLGDEVWRLEKIGRKGAYHQALSDSGMVMLSM